jgi:hypothetical protein
MSKVFGLGSNGRVDNCSTAPTHPTRRSSVKSPKEIFEEFGPRLVACILGPSASRERIRPLGNRVRSDHGATNDAARNWLKNSHKRAKSRISLSMLMRCARFIRRMLRHLRAPRQPEVHPERCARRANGARSGNRPRGRTPEVRCQNDADGALCMGECAVNLAHASAVPLPDRVPDRAVCALPGCTSLI